MKTFKSMLVLFTTILLAAGCSEKSQLLNEPLTSENTNSLSKVSITNFTATEIPIQMIAPGTMKMVGQNFIAKGMIMESSFESGNSLIQGNIMITLNGKLNVNNGEGPLYGKFTLTPDAFPGSIWKGNWTGYRKMTGDMEWTMNIQLIGHGEGEVVVGMMFFADEDVISNTLLGNGVYTGEVTGHIKYKE